MVMKVIDGHNLAGRRRDVGLQPGAGWLSGVQLRHLPPQ
jgi:hypothetical protein